MIRRDALHRVVALMISAALVFLFQSCAHNVVGGSENATEDHVVPADPLPPDPPSIAKSEMVRFHMNRHFDDLRAVEHFLVAGKLAEAKALTFLLMQADLAPGMQQWNVDSERVSAAARGLMSARTIEQACRGEARIASACMDCHRHTQNVHIFAAPPGVPSSEPTIAARMERHQWAVDRLWEGIVGAEDGSWHMGLEVLATTPMPFATNAPLASHLQDVAQHAFDAEATTAIRDRATAYGDILVTCSACHSTLRRVPPIVAPTTVSKATR